MVRTSYGLAIWRFQTRDTRSEIRSDYSLIERICRHSRHRI
jgi:hypothetical protein